MNENQKRNLDAVSRIDDDIIEKQTQKRVRLLSGGAKGRSPKKKWYIIGGSVAAALLLVLGTVLLLVNLLTKQVPVYTGMTVANSAPTATAGVGSFTVLELNAEGNNGNHYGQYKGDYKHDHGDLADPFEKPLEDSLTVVGAAEERYYAKANEDIYITVHVDNPDSFEILSFTLNGEKYSSYMFEAGSDLENLILKVNVGATEGVVDYTIDAIKYVDGTEIKDVRMDGEKTVNVGVYTDKQPTATIGGVTVGFNSVGFTVSGTDELGLIADSEGKVEAVLYNGDTIIATKSISLTEGASVTFDGLTPNTLYEYAVVATYDALDGKGFSSYVLKKQAFYTEAPMLFDSVALTTTSVSFDFIRHANAGGAAIESIVLSDGTTTQNLGAGATSKDGLLPGTAYTLTATYRNGDRTETITLEFTTAPLTYTVIHQLEKVDGTYETVDTVTEVIALGQTIAAPVQSHTGFTAPDAQSVTGALGEPLTITYQYPRAMVAITLVCNDGTTSTELLKYGTGLPIDIAREGYVFGSWFTDAECTNPITTVPAEPIAVYAQWENETMVGALSYTADNKGITIKGLKTDLTSLVIPAYIGGVPVLKIAPKAFTGRAQLTVLRLPDTLTEIGSGAFLGCMGITELTIPEKVTGIGNYAFEGMKKLTKINFNAINITSANTTADMFSDAGNESSGITVVFGAKVKAVPVNLFAHDGAVGKSSPNIKTVTFAEGSVCTDINGWAFKNCTTLQSVTLPSSLKAIYTYAFFNTSISSVELPSSVTNIKTYAFAGCTQLSTVTFAMGSQLTSIGTGAFENVPVVTATIPALAIASLSKANLESITILDGEYLAANAFSGATKLKTVVLPDTLKTINTNAFKNCTALTKVNIPSSVTSIAGYAFAGCTALQGYEHGNAVYLGNESNKYIVLLRAKSLDIASCDIHNTARWIQSEAFRGCTVLTEMTIPASVTSIGEAAFLGCTGLTSMVIPATVQTINYRILEGCTKLQSLTIPFVGKIANPGTAKDQYPLGHLFGGNQYDGTTVTKQTYNGYVGDNRQSVTGTYYVPDSLKSVTVLGGTINMGAFQNCKHITSVTLPESVQYIQSNAFSGATKLKTVALPNTLETINESAFKGCAALTEITIPENVKNIKASTFENCTALTKINFNAKSAANLVADTFSAAGSAGEGITVTFGADVTYVPQYLFAHDGAEGKSAPNIKAVIFAQGSVCSNIGGHAFENCTSLQSVTWPSSLKIIYTYAFYNTSLATVELPASVTDLKTYAFASCTKLSTVTLSENLANIGANAFNGCSLIENLTIPAKVETIGASAFEKCTALKTVTILGTSLTTIGERVFYNCKALETVTLPASLTTVGKDAFNWCTKLTDVYFGGTKTQWDAITFGNEYANPCKQADHLWIDGVDVMATT